MLKKTSLHDCINDTAIRDTVSYRRTPMIAAIIAGGAILIGTLGWWSARSRDSSTLANAKLVGRIIDKNTGATIGRAKVSLESADVPIVAFSDSEGIFSLPINDLRNEINVRVEAEGYENYTLRIIPGKNQGIQEIGLSSRRLYSLSPTPSQTAESKSAVSQQTLQPKSESTVNSLEVPLRVRGRVIDAQTGEPVGGVRVMVTGFPNEAIITAVDGEFNLNSHKTRSETFRLRAERRGYSSREQWHEAGNERATIRLTRE